MKYAHIRMFERSWSGSRTNPIISLAKFDFFPIPIGGHEESCYYRYAFLLQRHWCEKRRYELYVLFGRQKTHVIDNALMWIRRIFASFFYLSAATRSRSRFNFCVVEWMYTLYTFSQARTFLRIFDGDLWIEFDRNKKKNFSN